MNSNQPLLRTIHFYGRDRKLFGCKSVTLAGDNMAVLWSGIFSRFGRHHKERVVSTPYQVRFGSLRKENIEQEVVHELGDTKDIHILPQLKGSGGKTGAIIMGVVMVVIGIVMIVSSWGTLTAPGGMTVANGLAMMGAVSVAMSGAMMIYTAMNMPKGEGASSGPEERASFVFNGAANVIEQGGPVNCVWGRFKVGSTVVSAGMNTEEMATYTSPTGGNTAPDSAFGIVAQAV